jgi:glycogen(starch) synthase
LRILLVNYEYPPLGGGAANATFFLSQALIRLGHEPTILTTAFGANQGEAFDAGVCVVRLPAKRAAADRSNPREMGSFLWQAIKSAPRIARKKRADGAIAFFTIPCGPVAWLLNRVLHIPYVVSLRGGDVPGLVPELDRMHRWLAPLRRAVLRRAVATVANSESLARLSEATDPYPVKVIPNGVDADYFSPNIGRQPTPPFAFRILFVGRMTNQKNLPILIEALRELREEFEGRITADIVGDGPLREQWYRHAVDVGVAHLLRWHGWLDKASLRDVYRSADCFVNPSLYEGMPNTVLEAMACALPVVASDIGGNRNLVVQNETGYLFSLESPNDFTNAIAGLAREANLCHRLGDTGRRRVVKSFSWDSVARAYIALFQGTIEVL